ncbi:MAG: PadR family transcriptional regulator [Desulfobacteraceae bacterium]|nr:PadR family transcriptional regulator [Desulfobacteraceae bacterium]
MKVQLYILGFLKRHGAMHGYALKQILSERASDFARIKMSNIYYHFEKMEKQGLVKVSHEKEGKRPDRQVYSITPAGEQTFSKLLSDALNLSFDFESIMDGPLFFSEYAENTQILEAFENRIQHLEMAVEHIDTHKKEVLKYIPKNFKKYAGVLFDHHRVHYMAELTWAKQALSVFES